MHINAEATPHFIGVSQLATTFSVPKKTIYYWVSRNEIPYLKIGRHLRFDLQQVMEFFKMQTRVKENACQTPQGVVSTGYYRSLKSGDARLRGFAPFKKE